MTEDAADYATMAVQALATALAADDTATARHIMDAVATYNPGAAKAVYDAMRDTAGTQWLAELFTGTEHRTDMEQVGRELGQLSAALQRLAEPGQMDQTVADLDDLGHMVKHLQALTVHLPQALKRLAARAHQLYGPEVGRHRLNDPRRSGALLACSFSVQEHVGYSADHLDDAAERMDRARKAVATAAEVLADLEQNPPTGDPS